MKQWNSLHLTDIRETTSHVLTYRTLGMLEEGRDQEAFAHFSFSPVRLNNNPSYLAGEFF